MKQIKELIQNVNDDLLDAIEVLDKVNHKKNQVVSIFGSARINQEEDLYKEVYELSKALSEEGYLITTGGGPGLMEAGSRGAFENNKQSLGLSIVLPHEQKSNEYLSHNINFKNFYQRKFIFSIISDAYIVTPGGFGTMDELFEILTLMQCEIIKKSPIILYKKDFWLPLKEFIKNQLLTYKTISENDLDLIKIADNKEEVINLLK